MLRFLVLAAVMATALSAPQSNFIFKNDITPEEAQQYINAKSLPFLTPALSGRTAVLPLVRYDDPRFRSAEAGPTLGHYWKNGKEIENTDDYLEEVYNAAQYHGQDGLGQYAYGYRTPESSKVENREGSGLVSGSYVYKSGNNDLIKVKYWADHDGFHQEDNLPKVELKPAEETPALREARLAFEKAWHAAAEANQHAPQLPADYYKPGYNGGAQANNPGAPANYQGAQGNYQGAQGNYQGAPANYQGAQGNYQGNYQDSYQGYQAQASESRPVSVAAPFEAREGKAYNQQYNQQQQYNPQQQQQQYGQQKYGPEDRTEEPEPTGPPHGFFYSFEYPVSIIVPKNEANANPGYPVDHDTIGVGHQ